MKDVNVDRKELLSKVEGNRKVHREVFLAAQKGYKKLAIEHLAKSLRDARGGRRFATSLSLPFPQDHTDDYDRVIAMLKMSKDDTIIITSADFAAYVMDQWAWKSMVNMSNSPYLSGATISDSAKTLGYTFSDE